MILLALLGPGIAGLAAWFWASKYFRRNEPAVIAGAVALLVLILLLAGGYWIRGRTIERQARDARAAALVRDSLDAANDTLRRLNVQLDSGRVAWARRAFQAEVTRDDLDRALRTERRAVADLTAQLAALDADAASAVSLDSLRPEIRLATFQVRQPPYTVSATVEVPPPPDTARARLSVRLDPARLAVAFRCGEPGPTGIRPARVTVEGPEWLTISDVEARTVEATCNPPPYSPGFLERAKIGLPWAAGGAVLGALGVLVLVVAR